jgi:pyruvate,orthophosphate dikinase
VSDSAARFGDRTVDQGEFVSIDGTAGEVVLGRRPLVPAPPDPALGRLLAWADEISGGRADRSDAERLAAAHATLAAAAG